MIDCPMSDLITSNTAFFFLDFFSPKRMNKKKYVD